jgi:hypothetical protein
MGVNARLGVLVRTGSKDDSHVLASLMSGRIITTAADLSEGTRAVIDLDEVGADEAVEIGRRFRMRGAELVVAARPGTAIPPALARNLTG